MPQQVFGHSPDETAFFRLVLEREATAGAMVMIQPQLLAYGFNAPPQPVLLDVQSIQADQILLLDTFFMVIVHYGSTIAQWRKAGYQHKEEYAQLQVPSSMLSSAATIVRFSQEAANASISIGIS